MSLTNKFAKLAKVDNGITTLDDENCKAISFTNEDLVSTDIPILNVIYSGSVDGGLQPGIEVSAAPSGTGKTSVGLKLIESFQRKFNDLKQDHVTLYFDDEFGARDILQGFDIDKTKVLHIPILNIEEMHHNMLAMLEQIDKENVFIFVDSIGNLASKKELEDALEGKSKADMTRAKSLKAFFRQVTPYINLKKVHTYFIGHVYKEQGMFPKTVVSGGTGIEYAPNGRYITGKQDIKNSAGDVIGIKMGIYVDKSRSVKKKSKFELRFLYDYGIEEYSFLPELAKDLGIVTFAKKRSTYVEFKDLSVPLVKCYRDHGFWKRVFGESDFAKRIEKQFKIMV